MIYSLICVNIQYSLHPPTSSSSPTLILRPCSSSAWNPIATSWPMLPPAVAFIPYAMPDADASFVPLTHIPTFQLFLPDLVQPLAVVSIADAAFPASLSKYPPCIVGVFLFNQSWSAIGFVLLYAIDGS